MFEEARWPLSCRHSFALGTCARCYPGSGSIDPGPEEDYRPNLEGPGAVTEEEHRGSEVPEGQRLLRERVASGVRLRESDAFLKRRSAKVLEAEIWLRDLAQFFKDGEVRENMLVILEELERLRSDVKRLEERARLGEEGLTHDQLLPT